MEKARRTDREAEVSVLNRERGGRMERIKKEGKIGDEEREKQHIVCPVSVGVFKT